MIVVIQCAASKRPQAGRMVASGRPVHFVAHPQKAPNISDRIYAHPDDCTEDGSTWRQLVAEYNMNPGNNPLGLYPAFELYKRDVYRRLVDKFDLKNVYILSAGWGLIRADFLTPSYDITFSASAEHYARRLKTDKYGDFQMLPSEIEDQVVFLRGQRLSAAFLQLDGAYPQYAGCLLQFGKATASQPLPSKTFRDDDHDQLALRMCQSSDWWLDHRLTDETGLTHIVRSCECTRMHSLVGGFVAQE